MLTFATSIVKTEPEMKRILYTIVLLLGLLNAAAQGIPATAVCHDTHYDCAVYINQERPSANEGEEPAVNSVWWKNLATGEVIFVCQTNPNAAAHWDEMKGREAAAVEVPVTDIVAADQAKIAPGNGRQLIIEGCPDGRNLWSYVFNLETNTVRQLPSTEGVVGIDYDKQELILSSYAYDDEGRYSYLNAYTPAGQFLRNVVAKERE